MKSVKVYQVLGVDLVGVEHHKDPGIPGVVHAAVIQVYIAAVFGGRAHIFGVSIYVVSNQHSSEKHGFVCSEQMPLRQADPVDLERVSMLYVIFAEAAGVSSVSSKIGSFSKEGTMEAVDSPVKVVNANRLHELTAGAMEEHLFINLRHASFFLELSLFPAEELPQV